MSSHILYVLFHWKGYVVYIEKNFSWIESVKNKSIEFVLAILLCLAWTHKGRQSFHLNR